MCYVEPMEDAFSYDTYKGDARRILRHKQTTTMWASIFVLLFPPLMFTAAATGVIHWGNALPSFIAPLFYIMMMFLGGTMTRDNWWTFYMGTLVFARQETSDDEVTDWVNNIYKSDRVLKFSSHAFLFRRKRDATLFKMTWG